MTNYQFYCLQCNQDCNTILVHKERFNIDLNERASICHASKVGIRKDAQGNLLTR